MSGENVRHSCSQRFLYANDFKEIGSAELAPINHRENVNNKKPLPPGEVGGDLPVRAYVSQLRACCELRIMRPHPLDSSRPLPEGEVFFTTHHSPLTCPYPRFGFVTSRKYSASLDCRSVRFCHSRISSDMRSPFPSARTELKRFRIRMWMYSNTSESCAA